MSRIVTQVLGYLFLVLGVLGLFLPILQGFLFIAVGLILLSRHAPWARRVLLWIKDRHPKLAQGVDKAERWLTQATRWLRVRVGRLFHPATRGLNVDRRDFP